MDSKDFHEYAKGDTVYFGAAKIVAKEEEYIRRRRDSDASKPIENLSGLALSGGGIRSASFSLGVMQALAHNGWLKKIDYLSTVSGGGYAGSSLSWLLSQKLDKEEKISRYGVSREDFPYGSYPMTGEHPEERASAAENPNQISERYKGRMLRYLRQQAKYLTPGDGINALSLVAVLLRGSLLSLLVYFGMLALSIIGIFPALTNHYPIWGGIELNYVLWAALTLSGLFVILAILYSVAAFFSSWNKKRKQQQNTAPATEQKSRAYTLRQSYERFASFLLGIILMLAILGAVPEAYDAIHESLNTKVTDISDFEVTGSRNTDGNLLLTGQIKSPHDTEKEPSFPTALLGLLSTLFGALSGVLAFLKSSSGKKGRLPMGLVVALGSAALWFGLLLFAFYIARELSLRELSNSTVITICMISALVIVIVGRMANINYISIHRYYRDRLMEAFMPDMDKLFNNSIATRAVTRADKTSIQSLFDLNKGNGLDNNPAPYHLINTNVVLDSSNIPKFRGRGGDNFILSPYFCGSNATGWSASESFMEGRMTLPTAMAISGAAVNPGTGVGGQGVTRQPLLSMFMGLLNIRLGYWAPNPDPKRAARAVPNFFRPGLSSMLPWIRMHEEAPYVQLSDGGHFENLALYELIRRRARLIIVCDGGADPDFQFTDFANAQEKIRTDFGTLIYCDCEDLQTLVPKTQQDDNCCGDDSDIKFAERGYLMSRIIYPDNTQGRLIYIKTSFFKKLSADLYGYKKSHPQFPDEPTSDQFFDEMQFEAYRELGFQTAWEMMKDDDILKDEFVQAVI